jgi:hypothetical protein
MGITMTVTGRWGKPERPSFLSRRAHLLTTARRTAVVSLPLVGPCALPEASAGRFSRGGQTMPQFFKLSSLSVRLADRSSPSLQLRRKLLSSVGTACHPPAKTCHSTGHALRVRQLCRSYGRCIPCTVHFLLSRQKKQNRPLQGNVIKLIIVVKAF